MDGGNGEQRDRDRSRRGDRPSRFSDLDPRDRSRDGKRRENRVFISNVPFEFKWTDIKDLFRQHVGDVAYVELFNDEHDKPRGCGIVEFSKSESVKKALEVLHRFPLQQGRKLVIKEDFDTLRNIHGHVINKGDKEDRDGNKDQRQRNSDNWNRPSSNQGMNNNERFNTYGLSAQFLESIAVHGPLFNRLFVANLDYKVDRAKLKEVFKMAGKVRNIELSTDKEGNSRGFAIIEYDHPVEAVQAISMFDKQVLFDRKLTVRMDRATSDKPEKRLPEGLKSIGLGLGPNGEPLVDVARNLPQQGNMPCGLGGQQIGSGFGDGILGAVPASGLTLNGLGGGRLSGTGLNAGATMGGGINLQALGLTGLGTLQSQLLQQGLASGEINNLASAGGLTCSALEMAALRGGMGVNMGGGLSGSLGGAMGMGGNMGMQDMSQNNQMQNSQMGNLSNNSYSGMGNNGNMSYMRSNSQSMNFPPPSRSGKDDRSVSPMNYRGQESDQGDQQPKALDVVIARHLPPSMTWQLLREKFSEAGEVKFTEKLDKETAVIRFQSEWGAARAIKMFDRTRIDGRTIAVRYFEC